MGYEQGRIEEYKIEEDDVGRDEGSLTLMV